MSVFGRFVAYANEGYGLTGAQIESTMNHVYARGDRLLGYFVVGHILVALAQGFSYGTWLVTIPVTLATTTMFFASVALLPGSLVTRYVAGIVLQTFCALYIYQLHGMPEMHFYFFTAQTMMIVYEDWRATWPGTWLLIGQHILFAVLQNIGSPLFFYPDSYLSVRKLSFHFGIALIQVLICTYWAISQRRQRLHSAWQQLELEAARSKAERGTHAKSQFLANMSHEIRTPMNGVLGMTDVLLGGSLTPEQKDCAKAIRSSGEGLLNLLDGVLDISKMEVGHLELEPVEFSLREVLESVGTLFTPSAAARKLELVVRVDPQAPAKVTGDPTRLRQVLLNLTGNALKFTHQGHVLMEATVAKRGWLRFRISDTGIGIPEEKQSAVFDRFSQADESTTRRYGGSGLGLSISQELVTLMGGRISVTSEAGHGACFEFELPFTSAKEHARSRPLAGYRIRVLDGRALTRSVLVEMLEAFGAVVTSEADECDVAVVTTEWLPDDRSTPVVLLCGLDESLAPAQTTGRVMKVMRGLVRSDGLLAAIQTTASTSRPQPAGAIGDSKPFSGLRALVAEDNVVNQRVATLLLRKLGCEVDIAADGERAVEMWTRSPYDVVFMDCQMPELDGFGATAEIRRAEASLGRRTPIIALTANAMSGDRERCLKAGMDNHLAKPVSLEKIAEALQQVTGSLVT